MCNKRQDPKVEDVGLMNTGVPSVKRDAILHCILEWKEGNKYHLQKKHQHFDYIGVCADEMWRGQRYGMYPFKEPQ